MGSKLDFFAVDIRPLEGFLDRPLRDALLYFSEHCREDRSPWFDLESGLYESVPQTGVSKRVRGPRGLRNAWTPLSASDIEADPDLATAYREYVEQREAFSLWHLLEALTACPTASWVQRLSRGYRGWWIWSLLDWVERSELLQPLEFARYEQLFAKVLRGFHYGKPWTGPEIHLSDLDFPVLPRWDGELTHLGVWTAEDVSFFVQITKALLSLEPRFGPPPRGEWADGYWNKWVHEMLGQLLRIEDLGFDAPYLVSFRGAG